MDYDEEDNGVSGSIPKFGAIFMANVETKKECLKRKVFALPPSMADFVKNIKAGMVLFLFEYKKRQLFGVYQASSNGAMNIVPHGFKYSGRHYPAQVCFTTLWHCEPLSETEFRDAIRENYFSAKKFKFGLSEDQVHRLLYLFSSRKLMNKISRRPLTEANVEVACKDRRMFGYMEPDGNLFSPAAFCDHRPNSLARAKEDEVMVDDGISTEGRVHFNSEEDFLAKRRRLGNTDKLITSDIAENGKYNYDTIGILRDMSPKDALDEVRRSSSDRRFSPVERINKNQVDYILNRSGYLVDPLDARNNDDSTFMQRRRLFDEYKMHSGSGHPFESDQYAESLDTIKYPIQRDYNTHDTANHVAYCDSNLNFHRQAREWIDDQECFMNKKMENRCHLDCDDSPISAFGHPAMYKIRKGLPFNESEPDFGPGTCSLEGFSSEKNSHSLNHRNIYDRMYPIVERSSNENIADNNFHSNSLAKSADYSDVDIRVVEVGSLRNSKRADNQEDMSMEYPSFSHKQNSSSHPGLDNPLMRVVPYSPEHPDLSHGCFPPITANQNSSLTQEDGPRHCSPGNFYSRFKDRLPQGLLEPVKFSRPLDIAPEFGNKCSPNVIGNQSPLLHESTRSFINPNLPVHLDPNTSAPINYRGLSYSKPSPSHTDLENVGGENGMFTYPSKSRKNHFTTHGSQHFPQREMDMLANKDEAKDLGVGISHSEKDWASNEGQYFSGSSRMNFKELKKNPEGPHVNSNVERRSVFSRLTSKEDSKFDEEKNNIDFNHLDRYMHATADEVMELLLQSGNLSQINNIRESRVGGQPTHGESATHEKKHMETDHSKLEVSRLNDASPDGISDVPNETRVMDFKRRSDRIKCAGITAIPDPLHKIICANEEVKSPAKTTLKRRKLVRPNFSKTGSATNAICSNETSQTSAPILDKDDKQSRETIISCGEAAPILDKDDKQSHETIISCGEAETLNDNAGLASCTFHPTECNNNEQQKVEVDHAFPSTSLELKGHDDTTNVDLQIGSSQVLKETTQPGSSEIQLSAEGILAEVIGTTIPDLNLPGSCTEGCDLGDGYGTNRVEAKHLKTKKIKKVIKRIQQANIGSSL